MKVSIIIPVYNVEEYIEECIYSVFNQTYRDLEVIFVDDCGNDKSMDVVRRFIDSHPCDDIKFVILYHEKNRGLSAARNTGLKVASGDYVFFLDSDDYISYDCIDILVSLAQKYPNVDIVQGNYKVVGNGYKWLDISKTKHPEYSNNSDWIKRNFLAKGLYESGLIPMTAHNKLFNKSFLLDNGLWYKEGIYFEDDYWRLQNWSYIKSIAISNNYTYYYNIRESSITKAKDGIKKKWESVLIVLKDYLISSKNVNTDDIKYGMISLLWIYGIYKGRLDQTFQKELFNKYLDEIKRGGRWSIRYVLVLDYLQMPMFFVRMKILKLLL